VRKRANLSGQNKPIRRAPRRPCNAMQRRATPRQAEAANRRNKPIWRAPRRTRRGGSSSPGGSRRVKSEKTNPSPRAIGPGQAAGFSRRIREQFQRRKTKPSGARRGARATRGALAGNDGVGSEGVTERKEKIEPNQTDSKFAQTRVGQLETRFRSADSARAGAERSQRASRDRARRVTPPPRGGWRGSSR
jgi:hypothetical protein